MMRGPGPRMEKSAMDLPARGLTAGRCGSKDSHGWLFVRATFAGAR
jgi:hypothetical protein